jgi:hypothetical protein
MNYIFWGICHMFLLFKTAFYEPDGAVAISEIQNYPTALFLSIIVYLGQRVKCRRIANSRTDRLCCWQVESARRPGISLRQYKHWEYPPKRWYSPPEPHSILFPTHPPWGGDGGRPEARPSGPICYAFLPSRATRYNSDFPSFPCFGMIITVI